MPYRIMKTGEALPQADAAAEFTPWLRLYGPDGTAPAVEIRGREPGVRLLCRTGPNPDAEALAGGYRKLFETAAAHGWTTVTVPLFPETPGLSAARIRRIACEEIRRALEERELRIILTVEDEGQLSAEDSLLSRLRAYLLVRGVFPARRQPFGFGEPLFGSVNASIAPRMEEEKARGAKETGPDFLRPQFRKKAEPLFPEAEEDGELPFLEKEICASAPAAAAPAADSYVDAFGAFGAFGDEDGELDFGDGIRKPREAFRFDPERGFTMDESFSQAVLRMIDEKGLSDPQCYSRANLSRAVFNKLKQSALSPEKSGYRPSKSTALALAVGLELTPPEARRLLEKAGYALSPSSKADLIVEYCLSNRIFDIFEINEMLFRFGEPLLGSL